MRPDEVERRGLCLPRPLWSVVALSAMLAAGRSAAREDAAPQQRDREGQRRAALAILEAGGGIKVTTRYGISDWAANIGARSKDFFYVHYVSLAGQPIEDPQKAFRQFRHLPDVTRLNLTGFRSADVDWAALEYLKKLRRMDGQRCAITDSGLEHLGACTHLEFLDLSQCKRIKGSGFAGLTQLKRLSELYLSETLLRDEALDYIGQLRGLRFLGLDGTPVGDRGCALLGRHAERLHKLEGLYLWETRVTDAGCAHLKKLTSLKELNLDSTQVGDEGCAHLKELPRLRQLSLGGTKAGDPGMVHLSELRSLVILDVPARVTADGLAVLKRLPNLEELGYTVRSDRDLEQLKDFPRLEHLFVASNGTLTEEGLRHLERMGDRLKRLRMHGVGPEGRWLAALEGFRKLEYLYLWACPVPDEALRHLANLPSLVFLSLRETSVTSKGLAHLVDLPKLSHLDLAGTAVDGSAIPHLAKMRSLKSVRLHSTGVTEEGVKTLTEAKPGIEVYW